ncbi:MAG: hypothetical protein IKK84_00040 [Clostridia bacterium]|nr:hypothetical protein [Clostridia bacterium]
MNCTGRLIDYEWDLATRQSLLIFQSDNVNLEELDKLRNQEKLKIEVVRYSEKRSLDSNAYMWVLLQEIAATIHKDKWEVYLDMLERYGVFTHVIVKPQAVERVKETWRAVKELGEVTVNGQTGIQLQCYYGSSTYNKKEMARLLDGVVSECKEIGIETLTQEELNSMKESWGV